MLSSDRLKLNKKYTLYVIVVVIIFILLGIDLVYNAFYSSYASLTSEHERHLQDLALSTDRNVGVLIRGISDELDYGIAHNKSVEENYIETKDETQMKEAIKNSMLLEKSFIYGIQLIKNNEVVLCVNKGNECDHSYPYGWSTETPNICFDSNDNEYFSIISKSPYNDIYYGVLIDLDEFYTRIRGSEITNDYWVVLYDENTNVLIHNDNVNPESMLINVEDAKTRNDGISIIVDSELKQEIMVESYHFKSGEVDDESTLIAVIPSSKNNNGVFAIAVAMGMSHLNVLLSDVFRKIVYSGVLVLSGLAILLVIIYYNRRSNANLQEKIMLLDKENKEMAEVAHHQRLEMIGTMTSSIAHEFNNMLTPIMGYSIMLMEKLPPEYEELIDELAEIYDASERAKTMISRLSALSRKRTSENNTVFSPDAIVEKVYQMAMPSLPPMVEVKKEYHCPEECLYANETEIGQLLLNIVINAFQTLDEVGGGIFTISTNYEDDKIVIRLHDTGPGISQENITKIFDPFFTTKEVGKGTGLGLAISKQIAENYGGTISVESNENNGTSFIVSFPIHK